MFLVGSIDTSAMTSPVVTITRKECFSSAHRLHRFDVKLENSGQKFKFNFLFRSVHLSDKENSEVFGKCNHINGHGHNYTVEVSVRGPVDRKTGMVMNLTELKAIMHECIMSPLDHKNIDRDVPYFKLIPSTAENIAVFIWDQIRDKLHKPELLYEVKLFETDKNFVLYRGKTTAVKPSFDRRASNICANMSSDSE